MNTPKLQDLKDELIDYCECTEEEVSEMNRYDMVNEWLRYNGIIGYTDDIIEVLSNATGVNLEKKLNA